MTAKDAAEFLGFEPGAGEADCRFAMGRDLHGAFGGVFGGAITAASVHAARRAMPGWRPFAVHTAYLRALAAPTCTAVAEVVRAGRTVATVQVDLVDEGSERASRSVVSLAGADALHPIDRLGVLSAPELKAWDEAHEVVIPGHVQAGCMATLAPRHLGRPGGGYGWGIRVPWEADGDAAEAACLVGDLCVGTPVAVAMADDPVPCPNPDLSLRFTGRAAGDVVVGVSRLGRIDAGYSGTTVEVWTLDPVGDGGSQLLGLGLSSAVLLAVPG